MDEEYILSSNTLLDNIFLVDKVKKEEDLLRVLKKMGPRIDELSDEDMEEFAVWMKEILKKTFPDNGEIDDIVEDMKERKGDSMYVSSIERIYKRKLEEEVKAGVEVGVKAGVEARLEEAKKELKKEAKKELEKELVEKIRRVLEEKVENEEVRRELYEGLQIQ